MIWNYRYLFFFCLPHIYVSKKKKTIYKTRREKKLYNIKIKIIFLCVLDLFVSLWYFYIIISIIIIIKSATQYFKNWWLQLHTLGLHRVNTICVFVYLFCFFRIIYCNPLIKYLFFLLLLLLLLLLRLLQFWLYNNNNTSKMGIWQKFYFHKQIYTALIRKLNYMKVTNKMHMGWRESFVEKNVITISISKWKSTQQNQQQQQKNSLSLF